LNPSPVLKFAAKIGTRKWIVIAVFLSLAGALSATVIPSLFPFFDPTGVVSTYNTNGPIRQDGPFFQSLGTNGRSCGTCHQASDAMGLGVHNIRARFALTHGKDPLFAAIDRWWATAQTVRSFASDSGTSGSVAVGLPADAWRIACSSRLSFDPNCRKSVTSFTPAAAAIRRVVVPRHPCSEYSRAVTSRRDSRVAMGR